MEKQFRNELTRVVLGFGLLLVFLFLGFHTVQISRSTGPFDNVVAFEQLIWLVPIAVLIVWCSLSTVGRSQSSKIRWIATILFVLFLAVTIFLFSQSSFAR